MKWKTRSRFVDVVTGELLSEYKARMDYIIITHRIKYTMNNKYGYGIKEITYICEINKQLKIIF